MAIRKRTWKTGKGVSVAWQADFIDQNGKRHQKSFAKKGDADKWLRQQQGKVDEGTFISEGNAWTVKEAAEAWIARAEKEGLEASTVKQYREHADIHIVPALGDESLARLTAPRVKTFVEDFGAAHSTALTRKVVSSLKSLVGYAVEKGRAAQNVAREVKPPKANKREKKGLKVGRDIPTKEEMAAILEAALAMSNKNRRAYPLLRVASATGLRISELLGLRWANVDFDGKIIKVEERLDRFKEMGSPKSADSHREVPLPPSALQALKEWKLASPKGDMGLVFPNGAGNPEEQSNIYRRVLLPIQIAAGVALDSGKKDNKGQPVLKVKYGMHSLRHFYCSMLIDSGARPKQIQIAMGHATLQMTMDTYGHLFPSGELAEMVEGAFG